MTDTPYANSCQTFSITIPTGSTSASVTLGTPVGTLAAIRSGGFTTNDTLGNAAQFLPTLSLSGQGTSTATVTATRNSSSSSTTITVYGTVVDYTSAMVNTVQYGSVAISNATTGTTTLATSVNSSNAVVYLIGVESTYGSSATLPEILPYVQLNYPSAGVTQVTATLNTAPSSQTTTAYFVVVEYQGSILNQPVQPFLLTSAAAADETQTINSVVTGNAIIENGGMALAATNMRGLFYASLTNSTTVTFYCGVATPATTTRTHAFSVVEFIPNVVNVQRGLVTLSASTSATATINTINPVNAFLNNCGFKSTQTGAQQGDYFVAQNLTNATTVTANVGTASTGATSYEIVQLLLPASNQETNTATDATTAARQASGAITETNGATDAPGATNSTSAAITEAGTATDATTVVNITGAAVTETNGATDATTAARQASGAITEANAATDAPSATNSTSATITEAGTATDAPSATNSTSATITETNGAADNASVIAIRNASVAETCNSADAVSCTVSTTVAINEILNGIDAVISALMTSAAISETANASDSSQASIPFVEIFETSHPLDFTDASVIRIPCGLGFNYNVLIRQIRAANTVFGKNVGYIGAKQAIFDKQLANLSLPALYIAPGAVTRERNRNLQGYYSTGIQEFFVIAVISNAYFNRDGSQPMQVVQMQLEQQLTKVIGNYYYDTGHMARGIHALGYDEPYFNGGNFYITFNFEADTVIGDQDVWADDGLPLTNIDLDLSVGDETQPLDIVITQ